MVPPPTAAPSALQRASLAVKCPLTGMVMEDPVILASSGWSYERSAIVEWLEKYGTEPRTGAVLGGGSERRVIENVQLREFIQELKIAGI